MTKLIIIRHGAATPGADHNAERKLTPDGELQAAHAGRWVSSQISAPRILSSPYHRALQTAEGIAQEAGGDVHEWSTLTPDSDVEKLAAQLLLEQDDVVLVSHLPLVGRLAALLVEGQMHDQPWSTAECWLLEGDLIAPGCMNVIAVWYPQLDALKKNASY